MDYIKKLTAELVEKILAKGVRDMPQNPAAQGYSERQIREYYFKPESEILQLMMEMEDSLIKCFNDLNLEIKEKQDKLTSGDNITITEEGVISSTGGSNISNIEVDSELSGESENPVQNKVINEALDGKLDKVFTSSAVYGCNPTQQVMYSIGYGANPNVIAYRDENGNFQVNAPVKEKDCANMAYVNDKVKRYVHDLEFWVVSIFEPDSIDGRLCYATIVSNRATPYEPNEVYFTKGQVVFLDDSYPRFVKYGAFAMDDVDGFELFDENDIYMLVVNKEAYMSFYDSVHEYWEE